MNDRAVFLAALELPTDERAAYLDEACAGDDALRQHVERLLRAHAPDDSFLEKPAIAREGTVDHEPLPERAGMLIGPYKLLQQIGEGGMGAVYMAEQQEPIRRKVALKLIKPGMDSRQVIARFEAERQALAVMDHLNIAKVLDAGTTDTGRPYFVMELVHGVPITKYCDDNKLTPRQRLELFVPICHAIQHAHQKGIIHRDIKPSNVLICLYDGQPVPKVIDFGVAKAVEQRLTEKTLFTQFGTVVGTFEYMSPEQAEMSQLGVDTRSDIFSLGVLLYELLTGTTPLERQRVREAAYGEIVRLIKEEEPVKPSQRLSTSGAALASISQQRNCDPAKLTKLVRGELDWLVLKCLEKDRTRRYDTASGLARDVERYLKDEPVEACPPTLGYRLRKAVRKHKAGLTAAAGFAAILLLAVVLTSWQAIRATNAEADAARQRDAALTEAAEKEKAWKIAEKERDATQTALKTVRSSRYLSDMQILPITWDAGNVGQTMQLLAQQTPAPGEEDLRKFEWYYWDRQCHAESASRRLKNFIPHAGMFRSRLSFSADCRWVAGYSPAFSRTSRDAEMKVWDVESGQNLLSQRVSLGKGPPPGSGDENTDLAQLQICQEGTHVAMARVFPRSAGPRDLRRWKHLVVVDVKEGKELHHHQDWADDIGEWSLSPNGKRLAAVLMSGEGPQRTSTFKVWDLKDDKVLLEEKGASGHFSADSSKVLGSAPGKEPGTRLAKVWDLAKGEDLQQSWKFEPAGVGPIVYSPDGKWAAGVLEEGKDPDKSASVKVWTTSTGKEHWSVSNPIHQGGSFAGARDHHPVFYAQGSRLAVWTPIAEWGTGGVTVWDLRTPKPKFSFQPEVGNGLPILSYDGRRLIVTKGTLLTGWNVDTGKVAFTLRGHEGPVVACAFSADDRRLFTVSGGTLKEWEVPPKEPLVISAGQFATERFHVSPGAKQVACVTREGEGENAPLVVALWDAVTGKGPTLLKPPPREGRQRGTMAFSGDGKRIALGGYSMGGRGNPMGGDGEGPSKASFTDLTVWEIATGKVESYREALGPEGHIPLSFAPDLTRIVMIPSDGTMRNRPSHIQIVDVASGQELWRSNVSGPASLASLQFSPDGRRLAGLAGLGLRGRGIPERLMVWDAANGKELATGKTRPLVRRRGLGDRIVWSPDGNRLAIPETSFTRTLMAVYDAATCQKLFEVVEPTGGTEEFQVTSLTFSPDSQRIAGYVTGSNMSKASLKLWEAASGKELLTLEVSPNATRGWNGGYFLGITQDGLRLVLSSETTVQRENDKNLNNLMLWTWDATPRPIAKQP